MTAVAAWSQAGAPANATSITSVTCKGIGMCIAIVTNGTTLWSSRSTDFGTTWQQAGNLPASFLRATGLECGDAGSAWWPDTSRRVPDTERERSL